MIIFICCAVPQPYRNHKTNHRRYKILCANAIKEPCDPQKATQLILDAINLEPELYRMGLTKVLDAFGLLLRLSYLQHGTLFLHDSQLLILMLFDILGNTRIYIAYLCKFMRFLRTWLEKLNLYSDLFHPSNVIQDGTIIILQASKEWSYVKI